jgi:DNA-binding MarR family transcriptional regulator
VEARRDRARSRHPHPGAPADHGDEIAFPALQKLLDMTAGNLTSHLAKLEDAGYITVAKTFAGRKPVTRVAMTPAGRGAFRAYRTALLDILGGSR